MSAIRHFTPIAATYIVSFSVLLFALVAKIAG